MRITAELSLYPLSEEPIEKIVAFIAALASDERIEMVVNQLSTQLRGELTDVMRLITSAVEGSFAPGAAQALVIKLINADLPIQDPPVLERFE